MKKYLLLIIVVFSLKVNLYSQAFTSKNFNIDVGYVIGSHGGSILSPGVMLSVEKGVHKWIGIGAYTGIQYNTAWLGNYSHLAVPVGASGSFHFYQMIADLVGKEMGSNKLDIAVKHSLGVRLNFYNSLNINLDGGTSICARYLFNEHIGVYVEAGYPAMGTLVGGLAVKF